MNVVVRGSGDPAGLAPAVKQQVHEIDRDLPLYNVITMQQRVDLSLARRRCAMLLLALFAFTSLTLATIGIYGVLAYLVGQGTREIGIRMALGATRSSILRLVVGRGVLLTLSGVACGVTGALLLTRLMRSLLFGVTASDPLTFFVIPLLLILISLLATIIPAHRASEIDPAECLRYD
jgi:ABC-type antimicrobial peptide transport system permease subunit